MTSDKSNYVKNATNCKLLTKTYAEQNTMDDLWFPFSVLVGFRICRRTTHRRRTVTRSIREGSIFGECKVPLTSWMTIMHGLVPIFFSAFLRQSVLPVSASYIWFSWL